MTTILISIFSGILGLIVGFTLGRDVCAYRAGRLGKWKLCVGGNKKDEKYIIIGTKDSGEYLIASFEADGSAEISYNGEAGISCPS